MRLSCINSNIARQRRCQVSAMNTTSAPGRPCEPLKFIFRYSGGQSVIWPKISDITGRAGPCSKRTPARVCRRECIPRDAPVLSSMPARRVYPTMIVCRLASAPRCQKGCSEGQTDGAIRLWFAVLKIVDDSPADVIEHGVGYSLTCLMLHDFHILGCPVQIGEPHFPMSCTSFQAGPPSEEWRNLSCPWGCPVDRVKEASHVFGFQRLSGHLGAARQSRFRHIARQVFLVIAV